MVVSIVGSPLAKANGKGYCFELLKMIFMVVSIVGSPLAKANGKGYF